MSSFDDAIALPSRGYKSLGPGAKNCHPWLVSENLSINPFNTTWPQITPNHPHNYPKYSQIISITPIQVPSRRLDEAATCRSHDHFAGDGGAKPPHGTWAGPGWTTEIPKRWESWNLFRVYRGSTSNLLRSISFFGYTLRALFESVFFLFLGHLKGFKSTLNLRVLLRYKKGTFKKGPQDRRTSNLIEWGIQTSQIFIPINDDRPQFSKPILTSPHCILW